MGVAGFSLPSAAGGVAGLSSLAAGVGGLSSSVPPSGAGVSAFGSAPEREKSQCETDHAFLHESEK